jgi:hypothetical protein
VYETLAGSVGLEMKTRNGHCLGGNRWFSEECRRGKWEIMKSIKKMEMWQD